MPVKRTTRNNGGQDALTFLKQDHKNVKALLNQLESAQDRDSQL